MSNLIAYIPTLNQRHVDWFKKHPKSELFLIPQEMAEEVVPRLKRNMASVATELMVQMIGGTELVERVSIIRPFKPLPVGELIFPDEDVSHAFVNVLNAKELNIFTFEMIWARWDMKAVTGSQPVIADVVVSTSPLDNLRMRMAEAISVNSPDWWRQIGAVAFDFDGNRMVSVFNTHMPNEYETYIFGDPRLNVDAGQKGKYVALHSEQAIIALCARYGLSILGASVYVTTFPCEDCARWLGFSGVKRVFFRNGYSVLNAQEVLRSYGVEIVQVVEDPGVA